MNVETRPRQEKAFKKSRESDLWATPQKLFDELNAEFRFTMDPCCTDKTKKCPLYFTEEEDGLTREWWFLGDTERAFVNPPYSDIKPWFAKAKEEIKAGRCELAVFLVPSRTGTDWWHQYARHCEIRWIRGRIQFNDCGVNAPFDCCLVIMTPESVKAMERACQ